MNPTPRPQASAPQTSNNKSKPGRMTAVMRTLAMPGQAHAGPRIPRVAVVRGGRIVDEILVKDGASYGVTIGTSEKARIVVREAVQLPQVFQLIERAGNRYWLRFTDAMTGRVSGVNGISALSDLRTQAQLIGDGIYRVALTEDARGKVSLGDTTFLFQIVSPPPPALRPQLPISVKHGLGLDWGLTIIAAFSFLLHFGIAGAMYSDWLDPIVATDHVTAGLVELNRLPKPPPEIPLDPKVVDPTNPTTTTTPVANNNTTTPSNNTGNTKTKTTSSSHNNTTSRSSTSDAETAALVARAEQMQIDYLTVRANGSAVKETLDRTSVPPVDLNSAAEKNIGVTHDSKGDLRVATGGPVTQGKNNLPGLVGNNTHGNSNTTAGPETNTAGPAITVGTSPAIMNGAPINDADIAIAKLKSRFKKCYQDGLNLNPNMSGKATLAAKVGPNGEVISTEVVSNEGLSPTVTSCLSNAVTRYAQFTGNNSVTTVRIPVSLVHQ